MDFALTDEQREIRERAAEFADREVAPHAAELDREDRVPFETLEKLSELGFMGLCVPEEYGGAGSDFLSYCLLIEELSRADAGVGVTLAVHTSAGTLPIVAVRQRGAEGAVGAAAGARDQKIGSFALTEPTTGSDAAAIETTAERVEGGYRISGHKQWITNGRIAGTTIALRPRPGGGDGLRRPHGRRRALLRQAREEDGRHLRDHRRRAPRGRLRPRRRPARRGGQGARGGARDARPRQDRDSRAGPRHRRGRLPLRRALRRRARPPSASR